MNSDFSSLLKASSCPPPPSRRRTTTSRPPAPSSRPISKFPSGFPRKRSPSPSTPVNPPPIAVSPIPNTRHRAHEASAANSAPNRTLRSYSVMLQGCTLNGSLIDGKAIHARLVRNRVEPDTHLWDCLVNMYSKCGSLQSARRVFEEMPHRDVVGWTALITGYALEGDGREGALLFFEMKREGIQTNGFALAAGLKACSLSLDLDFGQQLHGEAIKLQFLSDLFVGSSLVDLYVKCGEIELAEKVFFRLAEQNDVSWNALVNGYARVGDERKALKLFCQLMESEMRLSKFTLSIVTNCCAGLGDTRLGQAIHCLAIKTGLELDEILKSSLVDMYSKFGLGEDAHRVFAGMNEPDVVAWSEMISCFGQQGMGPEAIKLFQTMRRMGIMPNCYTIASVAGIASELGDQRFGRCVHAYILKSGFEMEREVGNAVLNMYMKNGAVQDGYMVFDAMTDQDTVSWNALLSGFHGGSFWREGLGIFTQMLSENFTPNNYTFINILRSCTSLMAASYGAQVHAHILKKGLEGDSFVGSALIAMYAHCGHFRNACLVFDRLNERDVFAWTVIITGYTKSNQGEMAINHFCLMQRESVSPNEFTLASCLGACSKLAALDCGRQFHSWAIKSGQTHAFVSSALVDMYVKGGCLEDAELEFYGSTVRDEVSWNTMICGYSQHGYGEKALEVFQQMIDDGKRPDKVTFIGVLSACSHAGLHSAGQQYFDSMDQAYGITPMIEHYSCMVDILGKAGKLDEIERLIDEMTLAPDASLWQTVLGACRMHKNVELGERAAQKLFELDPNLDSTYILLSNIYAALDRWDDVARVRTMMSRHGIKKEPGCSWIKVNGQYYVFLAQDGSYLSL